MKNKLTVIRGERGGNNVGGKGEGFTGTTIKDTWTKGQKGGWKHGREVGMAGVVGRCGGKRQKTVFEQ